MKRLCLFPVVFALLLAACGRQMLAQAVSNSQIAGAVSDPAGALVPGATVTATQAETGAARTTKSGPDGTYILPDMPPGAYTLQVEATGFSSHLEKGIDLHVGSSIMLNVQLAIGEASQQVVVTADANVVETDQTSVSQVIDHQRIVELPLNGRQATQFILLSGAATVTPSGDLISNKNYPSSTTMSIAGGQGNGTNYLMDGGDNNDPWSSVNLPFPFPDVLGEFNVQYSSLQARYGVHPGGVVNVITRSGGNKFHGDLFEFLRNGDFNARNYFAATRDTLHRNQFGGTIGGPIVHDKLFFFGGYQKTLTRTAPPQTISFVPTQAVLSGDFSTLESTACQTSTKVLKDPTTGAANATNKFDPSRFNPQALNLIKNIPVSSDPCGRIVYAIPNPQNEDQYFGRVDWNQSQRHQLFARYFLANYSAPAPTLTNNYLLSTLNGSHDVSRSLVVGDTLTLSQNWLNSLRFTYTTTEIQRQTAANLTDPGQLGVNMFTAQPNFLNLTISGHFNVGCGNCAPASFNRNSYQVADDVDYILGKHHMAFGGDWIHTLLDQSNVLNANGAFTFNGQATGDGLADFLFGKLDSFTQGGVSRGNYRQDYVGGYVEDSYKPNQHLTLNAGLRWEPFMPAADLYNRGGSFSMSGFSAGQHSNVYSNAPAGLLFVGDRGIPRSYVFKRFGDFEPRLGLVWDPTGKGWETIRAGYGVFYDFPELAFSTGFNSQAPWGNTISLTSPAGGFTSPYAGAAGGNPFPLPTPPLATATFPLQAAYVTLPLNFHPTNVQQWDLSYDRQIGRNWVVSMTYLGNVTHHIWGGISLNPAVYIPGTCGSSACSTTSNTQQRRVLTQANAAQGAYYSSITGGYDGAAGSYNGLLLSAKRAFSNHYTVIANYTYSHCLSSGDFSGDIGGTTPTVENPTNPNADYGNCNFDLRENLNISGVAEMPSFSQRMTRALLTGWQIAPILALHSGFWSTPLTGTDNSLTGIGLDRPNQVGNPYVRNTQTLQWFGPTAYSANTLGTFGNSTRNSLEGPRYVDVDAALIRNFKIADYGTFAFRAEAFNLLNHTNFISPAVTLNQANTFGRLLSSNDPRILQLAAKFTF
jgi:hypothetical protein